MRPDVKLGIVASLVVVLGIGSYFLLSGKREAPIPVAVTATPSNNKQTIPANKIDRTAHKPSSPAPRKPESVTIPPPVKTADATPVKPASTGQQPPVAGSSNSAVPVVSTTSTNSAPVGTPTATPTSLTATSTNPAANSTLNPNPSATPTTISPTHSADGTTHAAPVTTSPGANLPGGRTAEQNSAPISASRPAPPASPFANQASPVVASTPVSPKPDTENAANETHKVQAGDSFASLSRQYYGSERHMDHLVKANPQIKDPARLSIGTVVTIPPEPQAMMASVATPSARNMKSTDGPAAINQSAASSRTYQVKSGDSFYGIARDVLGDANRWNEILALNREKVDGNPNRLRVGQVLVLPGT